MYKNAHILSNIPDTYSEHLHLNLLNITVLIKIILNKFEKGIENAYIQI
jgi:hypothetical protein